MMIYEGILLSITIYENVIDIRVKKIKLFGDVN